MKYTSYYLLILFCCLSCDAMKERSLAGNWQAASVTEDGVPMDIDPSEISFQFFQNGFYTFKSTLKYQEAGSYQLKGSLLHTLDTLNEASSEKAVKVFKLTENSLFIQMNANGKEQVVKFFRK